MKKYLTLITPTILILVIIGFCITYQYQQNHPKQLPVKWLNFVNQKFGLKLSYPESVSLLQLTDDDIKGKFIFRGEQFNPSALVSLRYEEKVGILKIAQKGTVLEVLAENINSQYPTRFPDFKKSEQNKITVDGREAIEFIFTYLGTDKSTRMKQRFIVLTKQYDDKTLGEVAFYLSFQTKESDFTKESANFENILKTFKIE